VSVFIRASRYQWQNDDPLYDALPLLTSVRFSYILEVGYTNLRCVWHMGCPAEIHPTPSPSNSPSDGTLALRSSQESDIMYYNAFSELFPHEEVPVEVGAPFGAQFAVSRAAIRQRSLREYIFYRNWLMKTELSDTDAATVLENTWHIIFGKPVVHCPNAIDSYCLLYGKCEMRFCTQAGCLYQWDSPLFQELPVGWPEIGWAGEHRSPHVLEELRRQPLAAHLRVINDVIEEEPCETVLPDWE
jgi:hypothetical protein